MKLADIRPHMSHTYGFTRAIVAMALAKMAGCDRITDAIERKAGRMIAAAKKDREIQPIQYNGRYYRFVE